MIKKKLFLIFIILCSNYIYSYPFKTYTFQDIKRIEENSLKYIYDFCLNQIKNREQLIPCISINKTKFNDYLKYQSKPLYGNNFFDYCFRNEIVNKKRFDLFYKCIDNLDYFVNKETYKKDINHLLLIKPQVDDYIYLYCAKTTYAFSSTQLANCLVEQSKNYKVFFDYYFNAHLTARMQGKFNNCFNENHIYDDVILINFTRIIECINN